jgi:hypothetical protein
MNHFFDTKEQYTSCRAAWASAVNSPKSKFTIDKEYGEKIRGWIKPSHVILYNIIRDKPFYTGFTFRTTSLQGSILNYGLYMGAWDLRAYIKYANIIVNTENTASMYKLTTISEFLRPFKQTVTFEQLASVDLPKVLAVYCYGHIYIDLFKNNSNPNTWYERLYGEEQLGVRT